MLTQNPSTYQQSIQPQAESLAVRRSWQRERKSEQWAREVREYNAALGYEDDLLFLPPSRR